MLRGIGTSSGIGIGNVLMLEEMKDEYKEHSVLDKDEEKKRYLDVKERFIRETNKIIESLNEKTRNEETSLIMKNQIYLINDSELNNSILAKIDNEGMSAEKAVETTCDYFCEIFSAMNNQVMLQRIIDIKDMKKRVVEMLCGKHGIDLSELKPNTIIVAKELQPSVTATMDINNVVGIVAEKGGETSHAAILAKALEIPAVLNVKDICQLVKDDDYIIIDGDYGEVFLNPIARTVAIYEKKKAQHDEKVKQLKKFINKETVTADNIKVCLAANIASDSEISKAIKNGAEGIGLFRTEFIYMNGTSAPTEEEQFEIYKRATISCKGKMLTIRTLDIGGDKDIPYMGMTKENNPFLGYRAIRYCLGRVDVFITQIKAILRASAYGNIRIMIPFVTCVDEILATKKIINDVCKEFDKKQIKYDENIKIGIMIETPSAAIMADALAKEVDFFSIGTNDLTQYTMAVDRGNENVAYLYSPFNPSVLRTIKNVIEKGHEAGIEVGMCGEAASNTNMIPLLLSFGLDEFSVSTSRILETRQCIASWSMSEVNNIQNGVMQLTMEKEVTTFLGNMKNKQ